MEAPAISVADLRVRRGGRLVLPGVSVAVAAGTVIGLHRAGRARTTPMRPIVGVQCSRPQPSGVDLPRRVAVPLRRRVGQGDGGASVYGDMSVRENLRYFARILGVPPSRVDEAIDEVDLGEQADQLTRTLSGGTPVPLATALLGQPELPCSTSRRRASRPVLRRDLWTMSPRARRDGEDAARLQPRDGRGRAPRRVR